MSDPGVLTISSDRRPPCPPRAIVFDCDGVLVDTEALFSKSEVALFAEFGKVFGPEHKQEVLGKSAEQTLHILERLLEMPGQGRELLARLYAMTERQLHDVVAMPGVLELVKSLHGMVPMAVASNSSRRFVQRALSGVGLWDAFDVVIGADDVLASKPAPDPYLLACQKLNVEPEWAIAIEDSQPGVSSAKSAGLFVIGAPSVEGVRLPAHLLVSSLADPSAVSALKGIDVVAPASR